MSNPPAFEVVGPFFSGKARAVRLPATRWAAPAGIANISSPIHPTRVSWTSVMFDGVYMDSDVWINGHHLGNRPYGYSAFAYDLTPNLKPAGEENILSVRVRNDGRNSRWYSGSGIYRHVTLTTTDPLRIAQWGVFDHDTTGFEIIRHRQGGDVGGKLPRSGQRCKIARENCPGPDGRELEGADTTVSVAANGRAEIPLSLEVGSPALWSPESPQLCRAEVQVLEGGKIVDLTTTTFGIREIRFSAEKGFTLNGESVELRGACLHHDNGPLGAAAIDRAEERKVELMKAQGYKRDPHQPQSTVRRLPRCM